MVTTPHPLSPAGKPVLVMENGIRRAVGWPNGLRPSDVVQMFNRTAPAAYWAHYCGKNLTGGEREPVAEYLRQWTEGPQLE
jgi:hypothetical protein